MARTSSIFNEPLSGNLGNQTLKNYGGTQVAVSRFRTTAAKGSGASYEQRLTRLQMPNVVLAGSQLKQWLPCLFEQNKYFKTPYAHFLSHNQSAKLPYLRKADVEQKQCHWGPLVVGCGSLMPITLKWQRDFACTSIEVPSDFSRSSTTIGALSSILVSSSYKISPGDYLIFIVAHTLGHYDVALQRRLFSTTPIIGYFRVDPTDSNTIESCDTLGDVVVREYYDRVSHYYLSIDCPGGSSAAIVHVRKVGTKYLCSPATMSLGGDAGNYAEEARSPEWTQICAESYGYKESIL